MNICILKSHQVGIFAHFICFCIFSNENNSWHQPALNEGLWRTLPFYIVEERKAFSWAEAGD